MNGRSGPFVVILAEEEVPYAIGFALTPLNKKMVNSAM